MEPARSSPALPGVLVTIRTIASYLSRAFLVVALVSSIVPIWIWVLASIAATGNVLSLQPDVLLLLLLTLAPSAVIWFFYLSLKSLRALPDEVRRLVQEGRLRSGELATAFAGPTDVRGWKKGWRLVRALMQLRNLVFRSKGLLIAAGMAVRLRAFNPAFLGLLLVACLATALLSVFAIVATLVLLW